MTRITRPHLAAVLLIVAVVQTVELLLLERKYDLFSGGFLQPHSYLSWDDRIIFVVLSLWMDLVFFGLWAATWSWLSIRRGARPALSAYNFLFLTLSITGIGLTAKAKIVSYFNDTLNFLIIKNLGGGSLFEAFSYVSNEASVIVVAILLLAIAYWLGLRLITRYLDLKPAGAHTVKGRLGLLSVVAVITATVILAAAINLDSSLRYGLGKKTSYALISKAFDKVTDFDGDGFGVFAFPVDPEVFDSSIYPGALDRPGNGIDEDGYGGDFLWPGYSPDPFTQMPPRSGDHILLIVLESARWDLPGYLWQTKPVTPNITKLSVENTKVEYAYSHTGYTTSSIQAILSRTLSKRNDRRLLADYLEESGYELSFLSGQDESFGEIAGNTGMNENGRYLFDARSALEDRVFPSKDPGSLRLSEDRIVEQFDKMTGELDWDQPQFIYVNLQAAHFPYTHPGMPSLTNDEPISRSEISEDNRERLAATYWNAIAVADQAVGSMIERLKHLGVYEETVVMITSDHGESLFDDHFLGHGHALNQHQTRIPLIINRPDLGIDTAIGQVDIAELLVELATGRFESGKWQDLERPQLQIVGSLDTPQLVGIVSHGDKRTILDLRTRKVFFSDLGIWQDFDHAWTDPNVADRTKKLILLWETARWQNHLARMKYFNRSP